MGKVCDRYCHTCVYFQGWYDSNACCNYVFMEDRLRGCDPGKGCIRKVKRPKARKMQYYVDRCVCCGEIVPEGRQVCSMCEEGV